MSIEEAKKFLAAKLECMEQRTNPSGCDDDCEACSLCYAQGTMGDQIEALRIAIKALEHEPMHNEIDALKQMLVELVDEFKDNRQALEQEPKLSWQDLGYGEYACPRCHIVFNSELDFEATTKKFPKCPNCGVKLGSED